MDAWEQTMFDRDFAAALNAAGDDPHRVVLALCALGRALETHTGDEAGMIAAVLGDAGRSPELDAGATAVGIVVRTKSKDVEVTMKGRAHTVSRPRSASSPPPATADTTGVVIQVGLPTDVEPDAGAAARAKRLTTSHQPEPDTDAEGAVDDDPWASLAMKVQAEIANEEADRRHDTPVTAPQDDEDPWKSLAMKVQAESEAERQSVAAVDIVRLADDDPARAMSLPVASDDEEDPWRSLAMKVQEDEGRPEWTAIDVHPDDVKPGATSVDPRKARADSESTFMRTPLTPDPDAVLSFADGESVPNAVPRLTTPEPTASIGTVIRGERPSEPDIEMSFDSVPSAPRTRTDQKFANVVRRNDSSGGIVVKPADEAQDKTPVSGMVVPFKPDVPTANAPALSDARSLRDAAIDAAFARAIATADTWLPAEDPLRARARLEANVYLSRVNRYPEAIARIREALAMVEAARGGSHDETADILVTLGYRLLEGAPFLTGKPLEDCERCLSRAISILESFPDRAARLDTARGYLAAVRRNREHSVVRDLRRMLVQHRLIVKFSDGVATLSGAVLTDLQRRAAIATAKEHPAVTSVVNDIALGEPKPPKT